MSNVLNYKDDKKKLYNFEIIYNDQPDTCVVPIPTFLSIMKHLMHLKISFIWLEAQPEADFIILSMVKKVRICFK